MDEQHVLSQVQTIFDGKVKYLHLGCPDDFHPKSIGFKERMNQVLTILRHHKNTVIAPKVQFTNIVVQQDTGNFVFEEENGLFRTVTPADGIVIGNTAPAAIYNADCHCGILYHAKTHRLVLMHLGLKCFYREDGSPDIIDQAITALGNPPKRELIIWIGAGINSCCNGYDLSKPDAFVQRLLDSGQSTLTLGLKVKYGPRAGQRSNNNLAMLEPLVYSKLITCIINSTCTSCQGREENPYHPQMWSNVRNHKERNLFLCWLT